MVGTLRVTIEDPLGLESAAWTSIAPMLASALATATHGVDPKDAGVASGTVNPRRRRRAGRRGAEHAACPLRSATSSVMPSGDLSRLGIGLQSGGCAEDELTNAGAFRVYRDTRELRETLDELGLLS